MYILYASLLNNKILVLNLIITIGCLLILLLIQYLANKARKYSITPIKESLTASDSKEKELPTIDLNTIRKGLPEDLLNKGFLYNEKYDYFTTIKNCKRREYGACRLYDECAAPMGIIIDLETIYFDYNDKHWLIQLQKGQYGLSCGGEISVYQTKSPSLFIPGYFHGTFYDSNTDDEELLLSYSIMREKDVFLTNKGSTWCLNSFRLGSFSEPEALTMHIRITFPFQSMCHACYKALLTLGYTAEEITVRQNTLYFIFDTPRSPQPLTRNILTTYIMQKNNFSYITAYSYITQDYCDTFGKLSYLKNYFPEMYQEIIKIGTPEEMFEDYMQLTEYQKKLKNPTNNTSTDLTQTP
ncbi:DUF4474 domain-containing protein [Anaerosporobacter faecicola]|uniref:DUF4474 domain-containing protein n=1 Tax=Anaerosporobacter faecicola TaxID=2718714 RepID=UPI00143B88EC|nr:DUF4474 domain-containing protein [Anaerosporobacter faecicola]